MSERFTQHTHKVIRLAQKQSRSFNHSHLGTEHLLLGLTGESASVAAGVLRRLGVEFDEVREQVVSVIGWGWEGMGDRATFTPRAKRVLETAMQESV
jgi:ATP-dependent Clp protease ATP-binding subunit ClpC